MSPVALLKTILRSCLLAGLFFLLAGPVSAQIYHVETIEESDGLPSPSIKSIAQDQWGRMWISSRAGVSVYDGVSWEPEEPDSLTGDLTQALLQSDHKGQMWILASGYGPILLHKYGRHYEQIPLPATLEDTKTVFTHFSLAENNDQVVAAIVRQKNKLLIGSQGIWKEISLGLNTTCQILTMTTYDNSFIVGTTKGIFSIPASDPSDVTPLKIQTGSASVLGACVDPTSQSLWLVGEDWIGSLNHGVFQYLVQPQGQIFDCFRESLTPLCTADGKGGLYLSGNNGTTYFHPSLGMEQLGTDNGLVEEDCTALFIDREKVMWLGTRRGISKIVSRFIAGYNAQNGLLSDEVTALLRRQDGTLVLGHNNGITLWGDNFTTISTPERGVHSRVLDLAEDSKGNVWIAGRQHGIGTLTPEGKLSWWTYEKPVSGYYVSVAVDPQDRVWIALGDRLLVRVNDTVHELPIANKIAGKFFIRRIILGENGTVYLATGSSGVIAYKEGQIEQWTTGLRDKGNSVYDVLETPNGSLWVGTRKGLYQVINNRLVPAKDQNYSIQRPVYSLTMDKKGRLWAGTNNGVIRISPDKRESFTVETGLLGRETNRSASLLESNGGMWMGTERGLNYFNPEFEDKEIQVPFVYLTSLQVNEEAYSLFFAKNDIILPNGNQSLAFLFRVFTTREPEQIEIRYKLQGFDPNWREENASRDQIIRYNNLPPGNFRFSLQARGSGQPWSDVQTSVLIRIPRPIWKRPLFKAFAGFLFLVSLVFPLIIITQRRYNSRLKQEVQQQVAANMAIEAELEKSRNLKSLGILAGGIAHDFNNLLTIILANLSLIDHYFSADSKEKQQCQTAAGAVERARELSNQLLTFSKGGAPVISVGSLSELVRQSVDFVLRGSNIKCQFDLSDDLWSAYLDQGQMNQVLNNLLINCREAMPEGGLVIIRGENFTKDSGDNTQDSPVYYELNPGKYVMLSIQDHGSGMENSFLEKIFDPYFTTKETGSGLGLATARSIVHRHNGELIAQSEPGNGTTMTLVVPASGEKTTEAISEKTGQTLNLASRVLIMDDEEEVRESLSQMLSHLGLDVDSVSDGDQALEAYKSEFKKNKPYNIVFLDLTVPGGRGGKEIISPLLEFDPNSRVIVISGYSHDQVLSQYKQFGFKAALAKPVTLLELEQVLHQVRVQ
ncbi:MAG: response regulator [bacterium]|nr:response regulator [bacterium]